MTAALLSVGLSSCQKKYDPSSFAPPINIGGYTSASEVAKESLIAHWGFDGNLIDSVSKTAGVNTSTTFGAGVKGQSVQGAKDAYVIVDPSAAVKSMHSFTVMTWVNSPQNTDGIVGLLDLANTKEFWGNLTVFFENGSTATSGNLKIHVRNGTKEAWLGNYAITNPWNKWMHVAISYDAASSTFIVYVNGSRIATQKVDGFGVINFTDLGKMVLGTVQFQTTPSLTTGTTKQDWASFLTGRLDEVRIYDKALTIDEIGAISKLEGRGK